jgi:CRISPR-associated endonuclease Cas1/CRISPR-associated protein Cas4
VTAEIRSDADEPLLPVRMLNEFAYCPRLFHLEWAQGEWRENADTLEGARIHRRVDRPSKAGVPDPAEDAEKQHARSVFLGDRELGLVAKIDLVEADGLDATPVDYKKARTPSIPERAYEPERVQVCAQGLLLRAHGYRSDRGVLYFARSKERVIVEFTEALIARTLALRDEAKRSAAIATPPPPLVDSPKCPRCSLAPICLPDEQNFIQGRCLDDVRTICVPRDEALPLHVQEHGSCVGKEGGELVIRKDDEEIGRVRMIDVSRVSLHGSARMTLPAMQVMIGRGVPISLHTHGGYYYGRIAGHDHKNVHVRIAQFRVASDEARALELARRFVFAKIKNCRVILRRNHRALDTEVLDELTKLAESSRRAKAIDSLLGIEGTAARIYFEHFGGLLRRELPEFEFSGRNRRPPKDPVNAMLSLAYSMLASEWTATLSAMGLDPYLGFLHQPRYGRPALALDMMEEFRPIVADSVVISAVNGNVVGPEDFQTTVAGVAFVPAARKRFVAAFERRMEEEVTHPIFGYRASYRRTFDVQARLLARYLTGEIDRYPEFTTR